MEQDLDLDIHSLHSFRPSNHKSCTRACHSGAGTQRLGLLLRQHAFLQSGIRWYTDGATSRNGVDGDGIGWCCAEWEAEPHKEGDRGLWEGEYQRYCLIIFKSELNFRSCGISLVLSSPSLALGISAVAEQNKNTDLNVMVHTSYASVYPSPMLQR